MTPYSLQYVSGPAAEPVTVDDVKYQERVTHALDDSYIETLIPVARKAVEHEHGRPIGVQTFELGLAYFPYRIEFPRPPLVSVQKITYKDSDEVVHTLHDQTASPVVTSSVFAIDTAAEPGQLYLRPTELWPADVLSAGFPVRITFTAGLATVPVNLKHAILLYAAHLYANREAVNDKEIYELPLAFKYLCEPDKFQEFR